MPRYKLRTLLIILAQGPPVLAGYYFLVMADRNPTLLLGSIGAGMVAIVVCFLLPLVAIDWLLKIMRG